MSRVPSLPVTTTSAEAAYRDVLAGCGAVLPQRDRIDALVVEQISSGTGKPTDSPNDVGGWPDLAAGTRAMGPASQQRVRLGAGPADGAPGP
jgi:hypothetical protein